MKCKLPTVAGMLLALLAADAVPAQAPATPDSRTVATNQYDGQQLVAAAAQRLLQQSAVQAKLRQQVVLFGQQLLGTGSYWQLRQGEQLQRRLELKFQVSQQVTSLTQVCDGRFMWIHRDMPGLRSLGRVDLRQLEEAAAAAEQGGVAASSTHWFVLGGLPQLLNELATRFQFGTAATDRIGDAPVWVVRGTWKQSELARLLSPADPSAADVDPSQLPSHVPNRVVLALSQNPNLPLFPQRIEFRRDENVDGQKTSNALVVIELFDVVRPLNLDPHLFQYHAGDLEVADHTQLYLETLGLKTSPRQGS